MNKCNATQSPLPLHPLPQLRFRSAKNQASRISCTSSGILSNNLFPSCGSIFLNETFAASTIPACSSEGTFGLSRWEMRTFKMWCGAREGEMREG